jgi:hypothetical protein
MYCLLCNVLVTQHEHALVAVAAAAVAKAGHAYRIWRVMPVRKSRNDFGWSNCFNVAQRQQKMVTSAANVDFLHHLVSRYRIGGLLLLPYRRSLILALRERA